MCQRYICNLALSRLHARSLDQPRRAAQVRDAALSGGASASGSAVATAAASTAAAAAAASDRAAGTGGSCVERRWPAPGVVASAGRREPVVAVVVAVRIARSTAA